MEEVMIIPGVMNLTASKQYDFALPLFDLDFDVDDYNYESGIFNSLEEKVGEFSIIRGIDELLIILRTDVIEDIPVGGYNYYVKRISKGDEEWKSPLLKGKFTRID